MTYAAGETTVVWDLLIAPWQIGCDINPFSRTGQFF